MSAIDLGCIQCDLYLRIPDLRGGQKANCPRCGFHFERSPGHFTGAVGMSTIITFGLILITLLIGVAIQWPDINPGPLLAVMLPIAILVPLVFHPTAKTLWVAIDLALRPIEAGEALGGPEERTP